MQDYVLIKVINRPILKYSTFLSKIIIEAPDRIELFIKPFKSSKDTWDFKLRLLYFSPSAFDCVSIHGPIKKATVMTIESLGELLTFYTCFVYSQKKIIAAKEDWPNTLTLEGSFGSTGYRRQSVDYISNQVVTYNNKYEDDYLANNYKWSHSK